MNIFFIEPDASPQNLTVNATSSTTINCSWDGIEKTKQNGKILGYKVFYKATEGYRNNTDEQMEKVSDGGSYRTVLKNLDKYVKYEVRILAYTRAGDGTNSSKETAWTFEDSELFIL